MNMEEVKAALMADPEKLKTFEETLKALNPDGAKSEAEAFSKAAAAAGCEISPEEVEREMASAMEMDDSELEAVSGGWQEHGTDPLGHDNICIGTWHCYYAFWHNSEHDGEYTTCWSDYICYQNYHTSTSASCGSNHTSEDNCIIAWEHN